MEGHTYSSLTNARGKWEALVNTVMNLWVRESAGSLTAKGHISLSRTVSHGGTVFSDR